jgi:hypothetical protein
MLVTITFTGFSQNDNDIPISTTIEISQQVYEKYEIINEFYSTSNIESNLSVKVLSNFKISPYFNCGVGLEYKETQKHNEDIFAGFYRFKFQLDKKDIVPFILCDFGIILPNPIKYLEHVGSYITPAIGISFDIGNNKNLSLAFNWEKLTMDDYYNYNYSIYKTGAVIGVEF